MSSAFEGLPQDPGVFSAPAVPRRSWPKIVAAFAAGAACTVLVITLVPIARNAPQPPQARILQRTSSDIAAPSLSATRGQQPADVPAPVQAPQSTQALAPPDGAAAETPVANSASAAPNTDDTGSKQAADLNCERQTWPYVDRSCAGPDANGAQAKRSVRVITTDRSAPATVMTAAPARVPRTTDGMAPPAGSMTDRTTGGSSDNMGVASRERAPVDQPQQPDSNIAAAEFDVPMPRPKPARVVRPRTTPAADDDGYTLVRSYRMRDGRRVSVQQKPVEDQGGVASREERPRSPFPFFFNPAAPGD